MSALGGALARARFKSAVKRVIQLLRLRREWAALGTHLAQYSKLFEGLERPKGKLVRRQNVITGRGHSGARASGSRIPGR